MGVSAKSVTLAGVAQRGVLLALNPSLTSGIGVTPPNCEKCRLDFGRFRYVPDFF